MHRLSRVNASRLATAGLCACLAIPSVAQVSVRSVKVGGNRDTVEIEVEASDRIVPQTQVLTGPDRLVVDFPNSLPSRQIRNQSVDRGDVKDVRVGLFQATPPVTRIVLDLKSARSYQIFPYGRTVMIKVTGDTETSASSGVGSDTTARVAHPALVAANYTTGVEPVNPESPLQVSFHDGLLGIHANKVTLSQVLFAVQQSTRAEIAIPPGAEQEMVVADIPPAPAPEVLAQLLNGSNFNFLILSGRDPRELDRVILTARTEGGYVPPAPAPIANAIADEDPPRPPANNMANGPLPPAGQPEADMEPDAQNK